MVTNPNGSRFLPQRGMPQVAGCRGWLKLIFVLMKLVITSLSFTGEHYANMNSNHDKLALQSTSSVTDFGQPWNYGWRISLDIMLVVYLGSDKSQLLSLILGILSLYFCRPRTHCYTEPYIIAANRQLSAMHSIYRLLLFHILISNTQWKSMLLPERASLMQVG